MTSLLEIVVFLAPPLRPDADQPCIPLVSTIVNAKVFGIPKAFFHAKKPRATNPTYANKKLHNLFPMSVLSLFDIRDYQRSSPLHLGVQ